MVTAVAFGLPYVEKIERLWCGVSVAGLENWVREQRSHGLRFRFLIEEEGRPLVNTDDFNSALASMGKKAE